MAVVLRKGSSDDYRKAQAMFKLNVPQGLRDALSSEAVRTMGDYLVDNKSSYRDEPSYLLLRVQRVKTLHGYRFRLVELAQTQETRLAPRKELERDPLRNLYLNRRFVALHDKKDIPIACVSSRHYFEPRNVIQENHLFGPARYAFQLSVQEFNRCPSAYGSGTSGKDYTRTEVGRALIAEGLKYSLRFPEANRAGEVSMHEPYEEDGKWPQRIREFGFDPSNRDFHLVKLRFVDDARKAVEKHAPRLVE